VEGVQIVFALVFSSINLLICFTFPLNMLVLQESNEVPRMLVAEKDQAILQIIKFHQIGLSIANKVISKDILQE
jgi:hypothetical protein